LFYACSHRTLSTLWRGNAQFYGLFVFLETEEDLSSCWEEFQTLVDDFNENFETNVDSIENRHFKERSELVQARKNYKKLLIQKGVTNEKHAEEILEKDRKKSLNKILKKKEREKFERILKSQQYHVNSETKIFQVAEQDSSL